MTLKKALLRGLMGFPLGVFISTTITVLISMCYNGWGVGAYSAAAPNLISTMGNELNAVISQYVLSGLLGFACAFGSAIWQVEKWSMTKQTVVHFLLLSIVMLPIAYFCNWVKHTAVAVILYFAFFASLYFVIWIIQYNVWKKKLKQVNLKLQSK